MFDALPKVSFLSSARLKPKPRLLVDTLSPNPVTDSFLFKGGRMFRIDVCESRANEFYYGSLIWFVVGERGRYF